MKTLFGLFFALVILLSMVCSAGDSRDPHGRRGNILENIADPGIPTHQPRLHDPFGDRWKGLIAHEQMPGGVLGLQAQVWVIDTALVYSTTDTTRHGYSFNVQARVAIDLTQRWANTQWVNIVRYTYTYDENGNRLTMLHESGYGQMVNIDRRTYTYDTHGRILTNLIELWTNSRWENSSRITYTYDGNGNRSTYLSEQYTNNQWVNNWRGTFTYDEWGNMLTALSELWTSNQWVNDSRFTCTYDGNGDLIIELGEQWGNNQWVNSQLYTYTYDTNGNMATELYELWLNNQWGNSSRYTYAYDPDGKLEVELDELWANGQWTNGSRYSYTYDPNGRLLTELYELWVSNQWENCHRYTYTYDSNGNMETGQYESCQGGAWLPGFGAFALIDSAGNGYQWNPAWMVLLHHRLIITDGTQSDNEIPAQYALGQNYPNPFNPSTTMSYQLPAQSRVTLKVYDMLGREVATLVDGVEEPGYKTVRFDASGLASGVYFYGLQAGAFVEARKMGFIK